MRGLDSASCGTQLELELQTRFSLALMFTKGNVPAAHSAIVRALELAENLKDARSQLLLFDALYTFETRSGDFCRLAELGTRFEGAAKQIKDPLGDAIAHSLAATTSCYLGHYKKVPIHARIALSHPARSSRLSAVPYVYIHRIGARIVLSLSLWMLGFPDQAVEAAGQSLNDATDLGTPATIAHTLASILFVYLQAGEWLTAEQLIARLTDQAAKHGLSAYQPVATGWQGCLAVLRGDPSRGIEQLQTALAAMRENGYELHRGVFSGALVEALAKSGRTELAQSTICETLTWAEGHCRSADLPELLRINAEILIATSPANNTGAEACFMNSLELAREQSALSLELRTAMSIARLWAENGEVKEALGLLAPIHSRFTEGFHTSDLLAAANLLDELRSRG